MAKAKKILSPAQVAIFIYKFISDNYKDSGVCLLADEADKTSSKRRKKRLGLNKIDVIYDGSIVGKITMDKFHLYFIFAGEEEVEIDFMPLYKEGKSAKEVFQIVKKVVRTKLAVDLEKTIGIMPRRNNPSKGTSVLGALILGGIIGHSMKK
jgi:hypothetical protein